MKNVGHFKNLKVMRMTGDEAAVEIPDKSMDATFIDAGHTRWEVLHDIRMWVPKTKKLLCGHDYMPGWPGVIEAVNEVFGSPDGIGGHSIWYVDLTRRNPEDLKKHI
jgi:hypothetical protein